MIHKVLFVDDEPNILESLKRLFRAEPFWLMFAFSGPNALDVLESHKISVIVSDMRMPIMDGVTFLRKAKKMDPDAVRVILSGYADKQTVMRAVEDGDIWRFVVKPWNNEDLIETVRKAVARHESIMLEKSKAATEP